MSVASIPPSILLADGDAQSRTMFENFFERRGWVYEVVAESELLNNALENSCYDIVIADVAMPGLDSLGLFKEILQKRPTQAIIAVSEQASYDEALNCFRNGATDLLARPIDFTWLERIVQQVMCVRRQDERERLACKFVTHERTEMVFSCRDIIELDTVPLPIITRLQAIGALDQSAALKVRLAVQEAVLNGLEHGNLELESSWKDELANDGGDRFTAVRRERLSDPKYAERVLVVAIQYDGVMLEISIKDQGQGFLNLNAEPHRVMAADMACSGRGLALMSSAVDEVFFYNNGSEVRLRKATNNARRA